MIHQTAHRLTTCKVRWIDTNGLVYLRHHWWILFSAPLLRSSKKKGLTNTMKPSNSTGASSELPPPGMNQKDSKSTTNTISLSSPSPLKPTGSATSKGKIYCLDESSLAASTELNLQWGSMDALRALYLRWQKSKSKGPKFRVWWGQGSGLPFERKASVLKTANVKRWLHEIFWQGAESPRKKWTAKQAAATMQTLRVNPDDPRSAMRFQRSE